MVGIVNLSSIHDYGSGRHLELVIVNIKPIDCRRFESRDLDGKMDSTRRFTSSVEHCANDLWVRIPHSSFNNSFSFYQVLFILFHTLKELKFVKKVNI